MLTRTVSTSAINQIRTRSNSIVSQGSNKIKSQFVQRNLSTRSLTLPSPVLCTGSLTNGDPLYDESFIEFIEFLNKGEDQNDDLFINDFDIEEYGPATLLGVKLMWETLPQSSKDIFISRALERRKNDKDTWRYSDIKELFESKAPPSKSGFIQFRKRIGPYLRKEQGNKLDERTISRVIGDIYREELSKLDKKQLQREAKRNHEMFVKERIKVVEQYVNQNLQKQRIANDPNLLNLNRNGTRQRIKNIMKEINNQSKKILKQIITNSPSSKKK